MTTPPPAQMPELCIYVTLPEEYVDVHPDLVLQDFVSNPTAWQVRAATPVDRERVREARRWLDVTVENLMVRDLFTHEKKCLETIRALLQREAE